MATNDIVLLDGILEQRVAEKLPSDDVGEVFEFLAFEQLLKDYDLSNEEIESGWVDGKDDGGIDGLFVFVNGHLVRDTATFAWPKKDAVIEVVVITAKHHSTFQQAPLDSLLATLPEFLNLGIKDADLKGSYSGAVLGARSVFDATYRRLAAITPKLHFQFAYASRGDSSKVGENISARAEQTVTLVRTMFTASEAHFAFVGAAELVALYRRTKTFALRLPFEEHLSRTGDSYVMLTKIGDYVAFARDDKGNLRRYLFDSNVRDYLGENRVNEDIRLSLKDPAGPEFWWLNNGVTILATSATVVGKTIDMRDVQIVNGLQTTETVVNHFAEGGDAAASKFLLVKIVVSTDPSVRDQIIRATNNQSSVEPQSLHATDKIQRDIEEILERYDWYYERRKNYYRNIGKPLERFVTPMYLAGGAVALILRNPGRSTRVKARLLREPVSYELIFSESYPLGVWVSITEALKRAEKVLHDFRPKGSSERFLQRSRNILGLLAVARVFGTFDYSLNDLANIDATKLTDQLLRESWKFVIDWRKATYGNDFKQGNLTTVFLDAAKVFGIGGTDRLNRQTFLAPPRRTPTPQATQPRPKELAPENAVLTDALIDAVNDALPAQPWPVGADKEAASKLGISRAQVKRAVLVLVEQGRRFQQRDGVLYDKAGMETTGKPSDEPPKSQDY